MPSKGIIEDARKAIPSVVQILAEGYDEEDLHSLLNPRFSLPTGWTGSGFFIEVNGKKGYILTNSHVVINARKLKIRSVMTSEALFQVEVVGCVIEGDPDIALLRLLPDEMKRFKAISRKPIPHLKLGDSINLKRGMEIKAIGYPYGMPEPNISGGELSNFYSGSQTTSERLVTDAAINPGNSGGPAIIKGGKVIGINTSIIIDANNIGFITPIHFAKILLPSFIGQYETGLTSLGAHFQANSSALARHFNQKKVEGVVISRLIPGGMLDQAGLERGDILLAINGVKIDRYGNMPESHHEKKVNIIDFSREIEIGDKVKITYFNKGKKRNLTVKASAIPTFGIQFQPAVHKRRYILAGGMIIQELSYEIVDGLSETLNENYWKEIEASKYSEKPFLVVTYIDSDSQADELHIRLGEVIASIDGKPFKGDLKKLSTLIKGKRKKRQKELLLEFRSGRYGSFELDGEFEDVEIKRCCMEI